MVSILHISNDFGATEVYKNLYFHLDDLGIRQTIFVPLNYYGKAQKGNHDFEFKTKGSIIIYSESQKWYHRYLYELKISSVLNDLQRKVDLNEIDLIHSSTLCMGGAVAHEVYKRKNIPYIVSVRNTDINTYFKKLWWKISYYNKILIKSSSIVFISKQYLKDCIEIHFQKKIVETIRAKVKVIPNGIDSFFLENRQYRVKSLNKSIELVFAAGFSKNKNLIRLIQAVELIRNKGLDIRLTAIGFGLPNRKVTVEYMNLITDIIRNKPYVELMGHKDKSALCEDYKNRDIFVMPSIHETFGLSYVEALSQGLPILYTSGQGFDGFYPDGHIGKAVNALDVTDIASGIEYIINNYSRISENVSNLDFDNNFNWNNIAKKYQQLYNSILNLK